MTVMLVGTEKGAHVLREGDGGQPSRLTGPEPVRDGSTLRSAGGLAGG